MISGRGLIKQQVLNYSCTHLCVSCSGAQIYPANHPSKIKFWMLFCSRFFAAQDFNSLKEASELLPKDLDLSLCPLPWLGKSCRGAKCLCPAPRSCQTSLCMAWGECGPELAHSLIFRAIINLLSSCELWNSPRILNSLPAEGLVPSQLVSPMSVPIFWEDGTQLGSPREQKSQT